MLLRMDLITPCCKELSDRFRTGGEPLDTLLRFKVTNLRGTFFNLDLNITIKS